MTTDVNACFRSFRRSGKPVVMVTAYDAASARFAAEGGVDLVLVGDSLANTVLGYQSPREVSLGEMLHHARATARGADGLHLVGDMPVGTYDTPAGAVAAAREFIGAGCASVKFEGGRPEIARALTDAGIPAVGHIGLTPQTAETYRVQGKTAEDRRRLLDEAAALEDAGIGLLIIECVPGGLGREITDTVSIPTVGIGAGNGCGGQVLVISDLLGMNTGRVPKFVRTYESFNDKAVDAVRRYADDVRNGRYPSDAESYH